MCAIGLSCLLKDIGTGVDHQKYKENLATLRKPTEGTHIYWKQEIKTGKNSNTKDKK